MADRIDIFGDGTGVAEPEVPVFLGVEQEKLTKSQYQSQYTDFFSQYYGMEALEGVGIGIEDDPDEPEDITQAPSFDTDTGVGRDEVDRGTLDSMGLDFGNPDDLSFDYSGGATSFNSYSDYLKTNPSMYDRVPLTEFFTEPLFTGNFSDIDFSEAAFGEYKSLETSIKEAPAKLGDILKGNITEEQKKGLVAAGITSFGGLMGAAVGPIISGETVTNAFGNPSHRPSGPLGLVADVVHSIQYNDMAQIRAAHAVNQGLSQETAADFFSMGPTGFAMSFSGGFGITRAPGSSTYTGNLMGLSQETVRAMDAFQHGMIPKGFDPATETGTTFAQAGWVGTGTKDAAGQPLGKAGGYYTSTGSFYSPNTNTYSAYGLKESAVAAAAKADISLKGFNTALSMARKGKTTLEDAIAQIRDAEVAAEAEAARAAAKAKAAEQARLAQERLARRTAEEKAASEAAAQAAAEQSARELAHAEHGGRDGPDGNEAGYGAGGGYGLSHARGGKVGYAFGTPDGGVQAPSGFIDAPPSQVPEGQKVADNRDMEVKEGTYILNAAAVEFAGEQDIRKMIMDAQKEAVRRGIVQDGGSRASELVDIAVSSGEVTIAPHLVKIIGEDRLEKINKRGLRKTEERIAQNGQQPAGAAEGGFIVPKSKPKQINQAELGDVELRADMEEFIQTDPLARLGWNLYEKGDLDVKAIVLPAKKKVEVGIGGVYTPKSERRDPKSTSRRFEGFAEKQGLTKQNRKVAGIHYFAGENVNYGRYDATVTLLHELRHHAMRHISKKYKTALPELSVEESLFDAQDYANRIQARKVKPSIPDAPKEKNLEIRQRGRYMSPNANKQIAMYQSVAEEVLKDRKVPARTKSKEVEGFFTRAMGMLGL
jgi:hypothetical protein